MRSRGGVGSEGRYRPGVGRPEERRSGCGGGEIRDREMRERNRRISPARERNSQIHRRTTHWFGRHICCGSAQWGKRRIIYGRTLSSAFAQVLRMNPCGCVGYLCILSAHFAGVMNPCRGDQFRCVCLSQLSHVLGEEKDSAGFGFSSRFSRKF